MQRTILSAFLGEAGAVGVEPNRPLKQRLGNALLRGTCQGMADLRNPKIIVAKGFLFLLCGSLSAGILLFENPSWRVALLLAIAIWGFARFYYFAFYVIQHYVDDGYRFAGLWSFARYLFRKRG